MRTHCAIMFGVLLTAGWLCISCGDKKNIGNLKFDTALAQQTSHLFGDSTKPACYIDINYSYPTQASNSQLKDSLNAYFTALVFGDQYVGETPDSILKHYIETYVADYHKEVEPMYAEDMKEQQANQEIPTPMWYTYELRLQSYVQYYERSLLVYQLYTKSFAGGAHGIEQNMFYNIDLNKMRPLTIEDLFKEDTKEELIDILWNQLMKDNEVDSRQALEDMGYGIGGELVPSPNFFLEQVGITFVYNVYEFAPYSAGTVYIKLAPETIRHLMKDNDIINDLWN